MATFLQVKLAFWWELSQFLSRSLNSENRDRMKMNPLYKHYSIRLKLNYPLDCSCMVEDFMLLIHWVSSFRLAGAEAWTLYPHGLLTSWFHMQVADRLGHMTVSGSLPPGRNPSSECWQQFLTASQISTAHSAVKSLISAWCCTAWMNRIKCTKTSAVAV